MRWLSRTFIGVVIGFEVLVSTFMLFHLGGMAWRFAQLAGAMIGGMITLISVNIPQRDAENTEPLLGRERLAWILIGCGLIAWGLGESVWRYYILTNQNPFPSYADIGYASLPPLIFAGLLLQPTTGPASRRVLMMLDSLIAMGALLAIGWYLLLGARTMHSTVEDPIAKFLGLYYSTADIALLSYLVLLLLEGQGRLYQATARRVSLVVMGVGICFFATSDFTFNLLQNAGTYMEGSWVDLGWPLGLMTIGLAAYLRRFLPITPADLVEQRLRRRAERFTFSPEQLLPYLLVMILFVVLLINVYSPDKGQRDIHPVLLLATIAVVGLVVVRQILTLLENKRLTRRQADALERLEMANRRVEDQARMMTEHNAALEAGITHLKDVQARLANGNLRARAHLTGGELLPLALNLNLMADRLMRLEHMEVYTRRLTQALSELNIAIDRYRLGGPFIIPPSCNDFPEINRLLLSMGLMEKADTFRPRFSTSDPITGPTQRTVPQPTPFQARPPHQRDS